MGVTAYYNEFDKNAAQWLRELIKAGVITDGEVDERSIEDVLPTDLRRFDRCHFFAGIGVWDFALQLAGWPVNRQIWTGSCPCQPFSSAGKKRGVNDERHLWPAWFHLIDGYRRSFGPVPTIVGEQVASKDGFAWLDIVQTDMEAVGYAVAAIDFPSCGVGAPHKRQRLWFVADSGGNGSSGRPFAAERQQFGQRDARSESESLRATGGMAVADGGNAQDGRLQRSGQYRQFAANCRAVCLADAKHIGRRGRRKRPDERKILKSSTSADLEAARSGIVGVFQEDTNGRRCETGSDKQSQSEPHSTSRSSEQFSVGLADTKGDRDNGCEKQARGTIPNDCCDVIGVAQGDTDGPGSQGRCDDVREYADQLASRAPSFTNGFGADADWLFCRDNKYRPVEPGTFPLVDGLAGRVGLLRGYGNAINPRAAQAFIESYLELSR